jgi:hypothetical protein
VISTDARDPLFLEERIGHIDDVELAEVDSDETPAEVDGGGRTSPLTIPAGQSGFGDGGGAAINPTIKNCERVLRDGGESEEEAGASPVWRRRCGGGGQRGPGERRSVRQLMVAG